MTEYRILGEIIHHCTKCKLDLNHRITLMDGDEPSRVLCLTCHTERSYKSPRSAKRTAVSRTVSSQDVVRIRQNHEEQQWKLKLADRSKTPVSYDVQNAYTIDDHVFHPTFGLGLVVGFSGGDKVQIYFEDGVKILKGKKASDPEKKPFRFFS